jgi:FixJ family two-component response regulator
VKTKLRSPPACKKGDSKNRAPTIFLVDDDPSTLRALGRLIRAAGFQVRMFAKPSELLSYQIPVKNACAVIDIDLPEMSGVGLYEMLVNGGRRLPTIFITALANIDAQAILERTGAAALLFKPIHLHDLLKAIRKASRT